MLLQTLSVGIFPYALKLLERSPIELRQVLVFIWAKIIMYDKSVQLDIAKGEGYHYFIEVQLQLIATFFPLPYF